MCLTAWQDRSARIGDRRRYVVDCETPTDPFNLLDDRSSQRTRYADQENDTVELVEMLDPTWESRTSEIIYKDEKESR